MSESDLILTDPTIPLSKPKYPGFLTVNDYLSLPRDSQTWLLKPLIPVGGAALLYGAEKTGKSYLGVQLCHAISGGAPDFLGFPVVKHGKVLYLQLDTPRSLWSLRFSEMIKGGLKVTQDFMLADRETVEHYPFDILQPSHVSYLGAIVRIHNPVAVVIDTLRESHSGDEDSSTISRNVVANLVAATTPAALILISHSRKPHPDAEKSLVADHRGSSYITGRMDAIMRLTPKRLFYTGRAIEEGDVKLERVESGLWQPVVDESGPAIEKVLGDPSLTTMRSKARALAVMIHASEEASMSRLRREISSRKLPILKEVNVDQSMCNL